ncbi:YgiQ family radical SAM protein [Desulfomarina sp.]
MTSKQQPRPLPVSWKECRDRGWSWFDILLVTGDSYIDHPAFGVALIGRLLESQGFRVAILSQPRIDTDRDFRCFPQPGLFCGITAGCLDSIVANYTGNGKVRNNDDYSPNGNPWRTINKKKVRRRPDRATLVYTSLARATYRGTPIVLGGVEASLRRFVHYDYKQNRIRGSFLTDAKADILVFGMGEKAILEIAQRLQKGRNLHGISGTCLRLTERQLAEHFPSMEIKSSRKLTILPSLSQITANKQLFLDAEKEIDNHLRSASPRPLLQKQQNHWVIQYPPSPPLKPHELDSLYGLPFTRKPHPETLEIPAYRMIEHSVTIVRGCSGNCSFCAITRHQGPDIISRSIESIVRECERIVKMKSFRGTISDLGGPTANLYGTSCAIGSCRKKDCLYPGVCPNLQTDESRFLELLKRVSEIKGIKHLFISSGLRMGLLLKTDKLLRKIILSHTPGSMKIAPEHSEKELLELMHKESHSVLCEFISKCRQIGKETGRPTLFTPYIIISHPGSTEAAVRKMTQKMKKLGLKIRKFQDFTPVPGTLSTAVYVAETHPETKKNLVVPRSGKERRREREILEQAFNLNRSGTAGKKKPR